MNRKTLDNYKYQRLFIGFLINKKLIIFTKIFHGRYILPFIITTPKRYNIEKLMIQNIIVNN